MPTSSTGAIYSPTNTDNGPQAASSDGAQSVILAGIPDDPKYCMDRFLSDNNETSAEYQRPPIEFSQTQSEDEAETKSKTRILAKLRAFDKKLASTSGRNVPHDPTYNMDRFLQHNGDKFDENYQRPLLGFVEPQNEMEAEERMWRLLSKFDEKFGLGGGGPSGN
ncbi:hypothetical protein TrVFT333_009670 [Trichoderma virens FT-333]|nr:hypothetical protein TrVFT333_009670 [Trichoderma virens FT-333]